MKERIISDIEISQAYKNFIEIARKYHLRVGTWKCQIFYLFEQVNTFVDERFKVPSITFPLELRCDT